MNDIFSSSLEKLQYFWGEQLKDERSGTKKKVY